MPQAPGPWPPAATSASLPGRLRARATRAGRHIWSRDQTALGAWARGWNHVARMVVWTMVGAENHALSVRAAQLTYYTVFSVVPTVALALWVMKSLHLLAPLVASLPSSVETALDGRQPMLVAVRTILPADPRREMPSWTLHELAENGAGP